jgi:hypothetical protein
MSAARSGEAEELTQQLEALKEISRVEVSAVQTELTALQVPHRLAPWAKSGSAGMLARCCSEPGQKMLCAWDATSSAAQLHSLTLSLSLSLQEACRRSVQGSAELAELREQLEVCDPSHHLPILVRFILSSELKI